MIFSCVERMRNAGGTLEDILEELKESQSRDRASKDAMKRLSKQVKVQFQKFGFVKYNAFKGMGGNLSFVIAMLDGNNTGFVLDVVHSREGMLYLSERGGGRGHEVVSGK